MYCGFDSGIGIGGDRLKCSLYVLLLLHSGDCLCDVVVCCGGCSSCSFSIKTKILPSVTEGEIEFH